MTGSLSGTGGPHSALIPLPTSSRVRPTGAPGAVPSDVTVADGPGALSASWPFSMRTLATAYSQPPSDSGPST